MITKQILARIEEYDTIIIHHHINPDVDSIGSQLGLKYLITDSFPSKKAYAVGSHVEATQFLGELDNISPDYYIDALVIIVDVGDKQRVDDQRFSLGKELIKIDHHPLSTTFGYLEWVDTSYAACTEMIIDLYVDNQEKLVLSEKAARVLYAGLLTDTGRFYYNYVTHRTLLNGALVYNYNFDKQALYEKIYFKSIAELKFNGYIINNFVSTVNGLGYVKVTDDIMKQFNITPDFASDMVNSLSNLKDIILWIFFVEYKDNNEIRVEFRSRGPVVNTLAKKYLGGGHMWASGALVKSWDIVDNIISDADILCKEYNQEN